MMRETGVALDESFDAAYDVTLTVMDNQGRKPAMGKFTIDMAHLNEEIAAGRSSRNDMLRSLKDGIVALKSDVGEMLAEFGKSRAEVKARMRQELSEFTSRLQSFADDLGQQVIDMRKGFYRERTQMLAGMDHHLGQFITSLKNEVDQLKTRSSRRQAESKSRPGADRDAFTGQRQSQARQEDFEHGKDDLTRIPGIGFHREKLFNQAGIQSFAQLARCTPKQLRQILGKQGRLIKVEALIAQARSMAS
jgi:predicted flap endonuclease-1-like 5' DNA nuclease